MKFYREINLSIIFNFNFCIILYKNKLIDGGER